MSKGKLILILDLNKNFAHTTLIGWNNVNMGNIVHSHIMIRYILFKDLNLIIFCKILKKFIISFLK